MKLKDWLTGGEKLKQAKRTVNEFPTRPKGADRSRLREAQQTIKARRRHVRRGILILLGLGSLTAYAIANRMEHAQQTPPAMSSSEGEKIVATGKLIGEAESGMRNFRKLMEPKLQTVNDPKLKEELESPFRNSQINEANPYKNLPKFRAESGASEVSLRPYDFFYEAGHEKGVAASFSPVERKMVLSPYLDKSNLLDMLILYHELKHSGVDANYRRNFRSPAAYERYKSFFSGGEIIGKQRIIITDEAGAYAYELEMLNLLLDGELKTSVASNKPLDPEFVREKLNATVQQIDIIKMLLDFSQLYFPNGSLFNLPAPFLDEIAKAMEQMGYEPFIWTTKGLLVRY